MDTVFIEHIKNHPSFSETVPLTVKYEDTIGPYNHLTFCVSSLPEFLKIVDLMQNENSVYWDVIYRGMNNYQYQLMPGIGRNLFYLDSAEYELVHEILRLRPEEFESIHSDFDLLSKMQHFGLKTRLLDFTRNPLVALFFACEEDEKKNPGRVVCTLDESNPQSAELIERICGLYRFDDYNDLTLGDLLGGEITVGQYIDRIKLPLYAQPNYSNERIRRQAGLFMVFSNQLNQHRFNLPGYEDTVPYMTKNGAISENCLFTRMIAEIDNDVLIKHFCSIVIRDEDKKKILKELEAIGITKAYLYPELEYTVQWVNNRFSKMLIEKKSSE